MKKLVHKLVTNEIKQDLVRMTEENRRKLWKIIQEAGDYLLGQRFTLAHTS